MAQGWVLALPGAPNPKPARKRRKKKMAKAKRDSKGRFVKKGRKKNPRHKKKRASSTRKKRTYSRKKKRSAPKRSKRRAAPRRAKKRRNPAKKRTYSRKRRRSNPKAIVAGMNAQNIGGLAVGLFGGEIMHQIVFGPRDRGGLVGAGTKGALVGGLAWALGPKGGKKGLISKDMQKGMMAAAVVHVLSGFTAGVVNLWPKALRVGPFIGERQYRLGERQYRLGERQYRLAGAQRPAHLGQGRRAGYGRGMPRHLKVHAA